MDKVYAGLCNWEGQICICSTSEKGFDKMLEKELFMVEEILLNKIYY